MRRSGRGTQSFGWASISTVRQAPSITCRTRDALCRRLQATASPPSSTSIPDGQRALVPLGRRNNPGMLSEETASWFLDTYGLKDTYSLRSKIERAALAFQDYNDSDGGEAGCASNKSLSLQDNILPKTKILDALSPKLGWKVFSRYPEEFVHPDAEDYWRIMAAFLYTLGFDPDRISSLFRRHPSIFARVVQDPGNLKELFDWFQELGLGQDGTVRVINKHPLVLQTSVSATLKPRLAFIERLGVSRTSAVGVIRRCPEILGVDSSVLQERVDFLLDLGLAEPEVAKVLADQPTVLVSRIEEKLQPVIDLVRNELGCSGVLFRRMVASSGLLTRSTDTIRNRISAWERLGIRGDLLRTALLRFPRLLLYPMDEPKYQKKIEFLREELGMEPVEALVAYPQYVSYSLPGRVAPRCLAVKGLLGKTIALTTLAQTEPSFLKYYNLSKEEYDEFVAEWIASEEAQRWLIDS